MCNKAVDNFTHALKFVPARCKTKEIFIKVVDTHPSTIKYVHDPYKTQEISVKAFNTYFFVFDSVLNGYVSRNV